MGHSDPKSTAGIYTNLEVDDVRRAVEPIDAPNEERMALSQE